MRTLLLFALTLGAAVALADDAFAFGKRGRKSSCSSSCEYVPAPCTPAPCHPGCGTVAHYPAVSGCCGSAYYPHGYYYHGTPGPAYLMPGAPPPKTTMPPATMPPKK